MSVTLDIQEKPQTFNYGIKIRLHTDISGNTSFIPFLCFIKDRFKIIKYTYGEEISHRSKRPHYHLHLLVQRGTPWTQKTPIQQLFKQNFKPEDPCDQYGKASFSMKLEDIKDEDKFLGYPLKDQETISHKNYAGMEYTEAMRLFYIARTIAREKKEYLIKKEKDAEKKSNTFRELSIYLDNIISIDPRWPNLIQTETEEENIEYLGKIKNITLAFWILGTCIVDFYREKYNSEIPWNIDKLIIRYLCQNNLVLSRDIYKLLSR